MCKSVQLCTKSMLSNGHLVMNAAVTALYSYGCANQLCFNSAGQTSRVLLCGYKEKLIEYKSS